MNNENLTKHENSNDANRVLPAVFLESVKVANEIEEQVRIVMPDGTDYDTILKVARYAADRMKSVIPMYIGNLNLNPKWELYDAVFSILNGRLNVR